MHMNTTGIAAGNGGAIRAFALGAVSFSAELGGSFTTAR
jgi:hypothetical protein